METIESEFSESVILYLLDRLFLLNGNITDMEAKREIELGEELFFDYKYNQNDALNYVGKERKPVRL